MGTTILTMALRVKLGLIRAKMWPHLDGDGIGNFGPNAGIGQIWRGGGDLQVSVAFASWKRRQRMRPNGAKREKVFPRGKGNEFGQKGLGANFPGEQLWPKF